jgi:hypothetical protein
VLSPNAGSAAIPNGRRRRGWERRTTKDSPRFALTVARPPDGPDGGQASLGRSRPTFCAPSAASPRRGNRLTRSVRRTVVPRNRRADPRSWRRRLGHGLSARSGRQPRASVLGRVVAHQARSANARTAVARCVGWLSSASVLCRMAWARPDRASSDLSVRNRAALVVSRLKDLAQTACLGLRRDGRRTYRWFSARWA